MTEGPGAGATTPAPGLPVYGGPNRDGVLLGHVVPSPPWDTDREVTIVIRPLTSEEREQAPGEYRIQWQTPLPEGLKLAGAVHSFRQDVERDLALIVVNARQTIEAYEKEQGDS